MKKKILVAIFGTGISTSYASYYNNESEQMLDGDESQFAQEILDLVNIEDLNLESRLLNSLKN